MSSVLAEAEEYGVAVCFSIKLLKQKKKNRMEILDAARILAMWRNGKSRVSRAFPTNGFSQTDSLEMDRSVN